MDEVLSLQESGIYNFDKSSLFKSQIEWLTFLINKAKEHSDICFIIRVHPREFPNKRDAVKSQNAVKLEKLLLSLPSNVIINWPNDNISLYEIISKVDLVLTFWSSAGLEASSFGCPIIVPQNPICAYTAIADKVSQTVEQYWNDILEGVDCSWDMQRVIKTFRWMWLNHFGGTISLESSGNRMPNMFNKLHDLRNWILKKINRKKLGFLMNTSMAYHGQGCRISKRKTNVKGENLIVKQILNHLNILDDFSCMHYPKSVEKTEQITLLTERSEVLSVLSKIFEKVGRPKKWLN
jgi:hypothetical protein